MKLKNILYVVLMIIFIMFSYLLFDRGLNTKTKRMVSYKENGNIEYKVYLHDNDIYDKKYLDMDERYISKLVDNIDIEFNYSNVFDTDINGYYSYIVLGKLIAYEDNMNDSLWEKEYTLLDLKANVLNENNIRNFMINDKLEIDYDKYKQEILNFKKDYDIDVSGVLKVIIKYKKELQFSSISGVNTDEKEISLIIPLTSDTFKINILNNDYKIDNYYDYSKKERVNYLFIVLGVFNLSIGLSFLILTIRNIINASKKGFNYHRELSKILNEYDDIIVNVKRFYNKKKYNLIYVDSFNELLDAYKKVGNPISFRETKKDEEAIFMMIEDDNAWIYKMENK